MCVQDRERDTLVIKGQRGEGEEVLQKKDEGQVEATNKLLGI